MKDRSLNKKFLQWLIAFGILCTLPFFAPAGWLRVLIIANFMAIFAMSWDIMSGYTGYVSFGHNFLIGLAGYVSVLLAHHLGFPLYVCMPIGVLAAAGGGLLFALPTLKIRGPYFTLLTLGLLILLHRIVITIGAPTGGTRGLFGFPAVVVGAVPNYYLSLCLAILTACILWYIGRSDFGKVLKGIYLDEDVVESSGLNTVNFKLQSFLISSIFAGVGSVFFIHYLGSIAPETVFSIFLLMNIIVSAVVGGMGTIIGPFVGAYILSIILEGLRPVAPGSSRIVLYALIGLAVYILRPGGVYPEIERVGSFLKNRMKR